MRDKHENDFFNSDYSRNRYSSADYQNINQHHNRDWADRASDEARSWFGDNEAERRRAWDEHRNYNSRRQHQPENPAYNTGRGYSTGYQPRGNFHSAYQRHYGTQHQPNRYGSSASGLHETRYGSSEYDPLRSIYGGPGHTTDGYSHESRRDFVTGGNYNASHNQPHDRAARHRDWADRTGDEVRSWFGDEEAGRRRRRDEQENQNWGHDRSWQNNPNHNRW